MTRLADLDSLPASTDPNSTFLWTYDGATDYKISVTQLRDTFTEIGALWTQATTQDFDSTGSNRLTMASLSYDAQNFTDSNSTGAFYIKDGKWSHVQVSAGLDLSNDLAAGWSVEIWKNGAVLSPYCGYANAHGEDHGASLRTAIIPVSSGDYFTIVNNVEDTGAMQILANQGSWFCIQPKVMQ